jgi:hypothetical protein
MSDRTKHRRTKESRLLGYLMTRAGVPPSAGRVPAPAGSFAPNREQRRRANRPS